MFQILTPEQSAEHDRELDAWWKELEGNSKIAFRALLSTWIARAYCDHDWRDNPQWLDKTVKMVFCRKCGWNKEKK